jgi:hypothetical protein
MTTTATEYPLPATVRPYPVAPEVRIRPDLVRLGQPVPAVDDPGPPTWTRLDDTTPAALEHLIQEWEAAPGAIRGVDSTVPAARWWAIALGAVERMRAEGDPRAQLRSGGIYFPFLGLQLDPAGGFDLTPTAPFTPAPLVRLAPTLRALILSQPPSSRVLDALRATLAEDLVVMLREARSDGGRAGYLCVAAPSGWRPGEQLGASFATLHRPVPHHALLLQAAGRVIDAMVERGPFVRYVWSLSATASLSHHPERHPAPPLDADVARWWLRVERQTTLPVASEGASLFAIRVLHLPLAAVAADAERAPRLAAAIRSLDAELLAYKGLSDRRAALLDYLAAHSPLRSITKEPETAPMATTSSVSRS